MERRQGIIIRTADYGEKDRLLVLFTPCGTATVTARGVRSAESKLKASATVMNFGEFTYGGRRNAVLTGAEITDNFFSAWTDMKKVSAVLACFELTEKCFCKDDETSDEFIFLLKTVNEIVYGQSAPICLFLKYAVFCAEKIGADYTEIKEYDGKAYEIAEIFSGAEIDEVGTLPYTENEVAHTLVLLINVFKKYLDIKLTVFKSLVG